MSIQPQPNTWKQIRQTAARGASSAAGLQRRFHRRLVVGCVGLVAVFGLTTAGYLIAGWAKEPEAVARIGRAAVVTKIGFRTDGVLTRGWVRDRLALAPGTPLLELDIYAIRERLESDPQVYRATVERELPDRLQIQIVERVPAFRILVPEASGKKRVRLVATDGTVYQGRDYEAGRIRTLPFLGGVTLRMQDGEFVAIGGLKRVLELVDLARTRFPEVYEDWRVVDLRDYDPDPEVLFSTIRIRGRQVGEALFRADDPELQLRRLESVVAFLRDRQAAAVARVDLRYEDAVPVMPVAMVVPSGQDEGYSN